jgi:hypothetical protein
MAPWDYSGRLKASRLNYGLKILYRCLPALYKGRGQPVDLLGTYPLPFLFIYIIICSFPFLYKTLQAAVAGIAGLWVIKRGTIIRVNSRKSFLLGAL